MVVKKDAHLVDWTGMRPAAVMVEMMVDYSVVGKVEMKVVNWVVKTAATMVALKADSWVVSMDEM